MFDIDSINIYVIENKDAGEKNVFGTITIQDNDSPDRNHVKLILNKTEAEQFIKDCAPTLRKALDRFASSVVGAGYDPLTIGAKDEYVPTPNSDDEIPF